MDLLKIAEREKYADVFDMFCTNSFLPKITFLLDSQNTAVVLLTKCTTNLIQAVVPQIQ